jgi:hypothetical protein
MMKRVARRRMARRYEKRVGKANPSPMKEGRV